MTRSMLLVFLFASCAEASGESSNALGGATSSGLPPSMSTLWITGHDALGGSRQEGCHAVLIAPDLALTAAHCFDEILPLWSGRLDLFDQMIMVTDQAEWNERVRFHPDAFGELTWTTVRNGPHTPHDLAVVQLEDDATDDFEVAPLWRPAAPGLLPWPGVTVTVGGHADGMFSAGATGSHTIEGLLPQAPWTTPVLDGTGGPNYGQGGDSGGGAFLVPASSFGSGVSALGLGNACGTASEGDASDMVLVGIAAQFDRWAATFFPQNLDWIVAQTALDEDGDGICDDDDNCRSVANTGQENCNAVAETDDAWPFDGTELGDACDPAPCAYPTLETSGFVGSGNVSPWGNGTTALCLVESGREIDDLVFRAPVRGEGLPPIHTSDASARYCDCRDATGAPSSDPVFCALAPNHCRRDPLELLKPEGGGAMDPDADDVTFWHLMSLADETSAPVAQPIAMTYADGAPATTHRWRYRDDFDAWVASGWFTNPPLDPVFGPGTELGGVVWAHDYSSAGTVAHGGASCIGAPDCSLVDGFVYGIEPDRPAYDTHCWEIPETAPPPSWTYCPMCDDGFLHPSFDRSNPVPMLALFDDRIVSFRDESATDVTAAFSSALRHALADDRLAFAAPSEPLASAGFAGAPRLLAFDETSGALAGSVLLDAGRFELVPSRGSFGRLPADAAASISLLTRSVYVVTAGHVFTMPIAGGRATRVALERGHSLERPRSVARSHRDGMLWVLGRGSRGLTLHRLRPETGSVVAHALPISDATEGWLTATEDGRIALLTSGPRGHRAAVLEIRERGIVETEIGSGTEPVAHPPAVVGGTLHFSIVTGRARDLSIVPASFTIPASE